MLRSSCDLSEILSTSPEGKDQSLTVVSVEAVANVSPSGDKHKALRYSRVVPMSGSTPTKGQTTI